MIQRFFCEYKVIVEKSQQRSHLRTNEPGVCLNAIGFVDCSMWPKFIFHADLRAIIVAAAFLTDAMCNKRRYFQRSYR
jgi:hypothetical protein